MAKKVVWTWPAREDLRSHLQYLVEKSPGAAHRLFEQAEAAGHSLAEFSERGRVVPELGEPERREIVVGKYRLVGMEKRSRNSKYAFANRVGWPAPALVGGREKLS